MLVLIERTVSGALPYVHVNDEVKAGNLPYLMLLLLKEQDMNVVVTLLMHQYERIDLIGESGTLIGGSLVKIGDL